MTKDWKTSKAKKVIAQDFADELIPLEGSLDVVSLYDNYYRGLKEFQDWPFDKTNKNHKQLWKGRFERLRKSILNKKNDKPPPWGSSEAKKIIVQHFIDEVIPLDEDLDTEDLYDNLYRGTKAFVDYPFDKENKDHRSLWKDRFERIQVIVQRYHDRAVIDELALDHDLKIHPLSMQDCRGVPRWAKSAAEEYLKLDINNGLHLQMRPMELRETRDEYKKYPLKVFRKHIYQEVKSRKKRRKDKTKIKEEEQSEDEEDDQSIILSTFVEEEVASTACNSSYGYL